MIRIEYTIQKLANLAGISTRTLRYYDEIGLLSPKRINSSSYRIYGQTEVDALQQILFFRELGFELSEIKNILADPTYNKMSVMREHLEKLRRQEDRIKLLIQNVENTILHEEGGKIMSDKDKFIGFKKDLIEKNETQYGKEIREKYGDDTVDESNRKMMNLSKEDYDKMQNIALEINTLLEQAVTDGNSPTDDIGKEIALLHKEWLGFTWPNYSSEAHIGLANMYVEDERFKAFYDKNTSGCAEFLRDCIEYHMAN